jgi:hypothetical protein
LAASFLQPFVSASAATIRRSSATAQGTQVMNLFEIEIRRKYKCDLRHGQCFGTVKAKQDGRIDVVLGEIAVAAGDPGDPIDGLIWLRPEDIHPV